MVWCFSNCGIIVLETKGVQAYSNSKVFWCSSINNFLQKTEFINLEHQKIMHPEDFPNLIQRNVFEVFRGP